MESIKSALGMSKAALVPMMPSVAMALILDLGILSSCLATQRCLDHTEAHCQTTISSQSVSPTPM
jgi:hypothetical protein